MNHWVLNLEKNSLLAMCLWCKIFSPSLKAQLSSAQSQIVYNFLKVARARAGCTHCEVHTAVIWPGIVELSGYKDTREERCVCGHVHSRNGPLIKRYKIGVRCMRGLNNPFPALGVDNVHRWFGLGTPSLLLREDAPWKKSGTKKLRVSFFNS